MGLLATSARRRSCGTSPTRRPTRRLSAARHKTSAPEPRAGDVPAAARPQVPSHRPIGARPVSALRWPALWDSPRAGSAFRRRTGAACRPISLRGVGADAPAAGTPAFADAAEPMAGVALACAVDGLASSAITAHRTRRLIGSPACVRAPPASLPPPPARHGQGGQSESRHDGPFRPDPQRRRGPHHRQVTGNRRRLARRDRRTVPPSHSFHGPAPADRTVPGAVDQCGRMATRAASLQQLLGHRSARALLRQRAGAQVVLRLPQRRGRRFRRRLPAPNRW